MQLLEEVQAKGIPANTITYNAAISAYEKGGQWQRALQLMKDMQAKGIPANTITYNAAISVCEKGRQW
jgi:pentatricopeptide repeat domain-containing protein 1